MSHFTVMVVTDTDSPEELEEALQPFHEYECTGVNDKYVTWVDETEEKFTEYNDPKNTIEMVFKGDEMLFSRYSDEAKMFNKVKAGEKHGMFAETEFVLPEGYELREIPANIVYPTLMDYLCDWEGYTEENFMGEDVGRWTNPNAKWDWWTIGGRWSNDILLKDGTRCDQARKGDVDFETMMREAAEAAAIKYDEVNAIINGRTFTSWTECVEKFNKDYEAAREFYSDQDVVKDLREYDTWLEIPAFTGTKEEYVTARANGAIATFAVVQDGEWKERGEMGWFACVSDEDDKWDANYSDILDGISDDKFLTIVDCHI